MKRLLALFCLSLLTTACGPEPTAPRRATLQPSTALPGAVSYRVINLGSLGSDTEPTAINNAGQVVGNSSVDGEWHAFIWTDGVMRDLGTLGGVLSLASDINASGQVVGESTTSTNELHGFIWENGVMRDLGTLGGNTTRAWGINRWGDVVGQTTTAGGSIRAFIWRKGVMSRLGSMESFFARAFDINNAGIVVGEFRPRGSRAHAFRWKAGAMRDLGTLGGATSNALVVNNSGTILGWSRTASGAAHNFLYQDGKLRDIGAIGASDLGPGDQVVGTVMRNGNPVAILWQDGVITEIGPGFGVALNQSGWIIVRRYTATGIVGELYQPS
jgi:probable HAF family extracellular repeat protein